MGDNKADSVVELLIETAGMYYECAAKQSGLAAALKNREK